jgi:integrase
MKNLSIPTAERIQEILTQYVKTDNFDRVHEDDEGRSHTERITNADMEEAVRAVAAACLGDNSLLKVNLADYTILNLSIFHHLRPVERVNLEVEDLDWPSIAEGLREHIVKICEKRGWLRREEIHQ